MEPFDLYWVYVPFEEKFQVKYRPFLILKINSNGWVGGFKITTQYTNKSDRVQPHIYEIEDLKKAGLEEVSYVDFEKIINIDRHQFKLTNPCGKLTKRDQSQLNLSIFRYQQNKNYNNK